LLLYHGASSLSLHFFTQLPKPTGETGGGVANAIVGSATIVGVAALIGCSPWTVRQTLIRRGIPHFRSGASGRLIFYRDQVIRWICEQQSKGGSRIR